MTNSTQNPSTVSTAPNLTDVTTLISALHEATQALLQYSQTCPVQPVQTVPEQLVSGQTASGLDAETRPDLTRWKKNMKMYQPFSFDPVDLRAFDKKDIAKFFEHAYNCGAYRSELRYYYVPAKVVRHEQKLLSKHQYKDISGLISDAYVELDRIWKLLARTGEKQPSITLNQLAKSMRLTVQLLLYIHTNLNNITLLHKTVVPRRN